MVEVYKSEIQNFGHPHFIAIMLMKNDNGSDLAKTLQIRPQLGGITHPAFIQFCHGELFRFKSICQYTLENLELTYKIKFCRVGRIRSKNVVTFIDKPCWGTNIVYIKEQKRYVNNFCFKTLEFLDFLIFSLFFIILQIYIPGKVI